MYGFALNGLREAVYGPQSDRLLILRYESLAANPLGTLAAVYAFIGEPLHSHDPRHIEPCYDMIEFDQRLGHPAYMMFAAQFSRVNGKPSCCWISSRAINGTRFGKTRSWFLQR